MDIEKKYMNILINNNSYNSSAVVKWQSCVPDFLRKMEIKDSKQIEIFLYIINNINIENNLFIGTYKKISDDVKCSQTTIAKIMKKLQSCGFLKRLQNGVWFVNTNLFYDSGEKTKEESNEKEKAEEEDIDPGELIKSDDSQVKSCIENLHLEDFSSKADEPFFIKTKVNNSIVVLNRNTEQNSMHNLVMEMLINPYLELAIEEILLEENMTGENESGVLEKIKESGVCVSYSYTKRDMKNAVSVTENIENIIQGTEFTAPFATKGFAPLFKNWEKPVTAARQLNGKITDTEMIPRKPGVAKIVYTNKDESRDVLRINEFSMPGVISCKYNLAGNIISFARSCFEYALSTKTNLLFTDRADKSLIFDRAYYETFNEIFEREYKDKFKEANIKFNHGLTDNTVMNAICSQGGFIWALNGDDGKLVANMVSAAFGGELLMRTVITFGDGLIFKATDSLINDPEEASVSAAAVIFAWTATLRFRGEADKMPVLIQFADNMELAVLSVMENGYMTEDLAKNASKAETCVLNTKDFILAIKKYFEDICFSEN